MSKSSSPAWGSEGISEEGKSWKKILRPLQSGLDLEKVKFDGERHMIEALLKDEDFAAVHNELSSRDVNYSARRNMLLTSVRLSPEVAPSVFACLDACRAALKLEGAIEIYVNASSDMNAFAVTKPQTGITCISFSSSTLENLDDLELRWVMGHELGHALSDHFIIPHQVLMDDNRISLLHVMQYYAWKRYAELTCDRFGLLCSGDVHAAVRTLFKMSSGLVHPRWMSDATNAILQRAAQDAELIDTEDADDWYSTHPYSPLRVKAIECFARSRTFHSLHGDKGGTLSEEKMEAEVAKIIDLMNPALLNENFSCKKELREYIALAGIGVAKADGRVDPREKKLIVGLLGATKLVERLDEFKKLTSDERHARMQPLGEVVSKKLPMTRRMKVLTELCAIANVDSKITDEEREELYWSAKLLSVNPAFIDDFLANLGKPLD